MTPFCKEYTPVMDLTGYGNKRGTKSAPKKDPMASNDAKVRMQASGIKRPLSQQLNTRILGNSKV